MEEVHSQHMLRTGGRAAGKLSKPALSVSRHNAEGEKGSADPAYSFFFSPLIVSFICAFQALLPRRSAAHFKKYVSSWSEHDDTEP